MTPWEETGSPVEVLLVEDHDEYRQSLEFFLHASGRLRCMSFQRCEDALAQLHKRRPDVVIMDIHLPGMDGIACTRLIKEQWPEIHILICTVHEDDEKIFDALRAGASGYLLKRNSIDEIVEGIRQVLAGGSPMSPAIARRVVNSFRPPKLTEGLNALSDREQEVLDLLCTGMSAKAIGDKLFVSANTVRTHIRHIYEKLQVQTRVEAVNRLKGR
ncbi:MAG: response regulator transcription factor [Flavobacteriales bacterium]|nr:response regulator transcription factor [Flavobacteriales bacterium]